MNILPALAISLLWAFPAALVLAGLLMLFSRGFRLWTAELLAHPSVSLFAPIIVVGLILLAIFASGLITGAVMGVRL